MYTSSIINFLSLPVFIYICFLLVRLALKYVDKKPAAETEAAE